MNWEQDARHAQFDGRVLARAQWIMDWWQAHGFEAVSLPWMAPEHCLAVTRALQARIPEPSTSEGLLVGGAEQAFLWLDELNRLPTAAAGLVGWTPCFRNEAYDRWHHHYFIQVELFMPVIRAHAAGRLGAVVAQVQASWHALAQFEHLPMRSLRVRSVSDSCADLMLGIRKLGSCSIRERLGGRGPYVHATALAEPRWFQTWSAGAS